MELNKFLNDKGYNKQLVDNNTSYPYYIQILEARGIILDRLVQLSKLIDGAMRAVAAMGN